MEWLDHVWFQVPAAISLLAVTAGALRWLWKNIVEPGWGLMQKAVRLKEIHEVVTKSFPMLEEINREFTPNGGSSWPLTPSGGRPECPKATFRSSEIRKRFLYLYFVPR